MLSLDFTTLMQALTTLVGGVAGTWIVTELIKRAKSIPYVKAGDKKVLRAVAGFFAAIGTMTLALSNDSLDPSTVQGFLVDGLSFIAMFAGSHAIHKKLKTEDADPSKESEESPE